MGEKLLSFGFTLGHYQAAVAGTLALKLKSLISEHARAVDKIAEALQAAVVTVVGEFAHQVDTAIGRGDSL